MTATLQSRRDAIVPTLRAVGQEHLLAFYDGLADAQQDKLLSQLEGIDWPEVGRLIESHVRRKPDVHLPDRLEPAPIFPRQPTAELTEHYRRAREAGEALLRAGKVAAFIVAGGQGTRLGWDAPKGTFPATPIRKAPLFQVFAEFVLKAQEKYGATLPLYVMDSPVNDAPTRAFFEKHRCFGLDPKNVMLFPQAMMPALDLATGRCLLAAKDELALSPNGHGGSLKALFSSGAVADMNRRGVTQISYVQVDNPNVKVVDPLFLGLHELEGAQMSSKALAKVGPKEKVGNFVRANGRVAVIEYSDMPDELAEQRDDKGGLKYNAGSIAIHAIRVSFVESLNRGGTFSLPFHRAEKKVPYFDAAGAAPVTPDKVNAVKLETFVFDALPLCEKSIILETDRTEEFAPIKNADAPAGQPVAPDSAESSRRLQSERAARWLESRGVRVARGGDGNVAATIELPHLVAIEPGDLAAAQLPESIAENDRALIGDASLR